MADGEKPDEWEVSIDPHIDSPYFRGAMRAMQEKMDQDRRGRMEQIHALEDERAINDILMKYWNDFVSSELQIKETQIHNWAQTALQAVANLAPRKPGEDGRLPWPEGALDKSQFLSTRSKTILECLELMEKNLDKKNRDKYESHKVLLHHHDTRIQDLRTQLVDEMDSLKKEHCRKTTTKENYYIPLDRPHASKTKPDETANPYHYPNDRTTAPDTCNGIETLFPMHYGQFSPSAAAMEFANIPVSDYQASCDSISLHPEILDEFESTGILIVAVENAVWGTNDTTIRQLVYQTVVLDRCRALKPVDITEFFEKMITQDHETCENFKKDAEIRYRRILEEGDALRGEPRPSSRYRNNRHVPARRPDTERSEPEYPFQKVMTGRCGKRGLRILTDSLPESRPRLGSKSSTADIIRRLERMGIGQASLLVDVSIVPCPSMLVDRLLTSPLERAGCASVENVVFDATEEQEDAGAVEFGMAM